ncbi:MAG: GTP-binding protein, partial [Halanaeroarchaeum sp.]
GGHADHDHRHPDEVYGVSSVVVRRRRPLDPEAFADFLRNLPSGVVRSKGTAWLAGRDEKIGIEQAGPSVRATVRGPWIASLPGPDQRLYRSNRPDLEWHDEHGDRRTELVFIGTDLDRAALERDLEACLLDPDVSVDSASDPFPTRQGEETVLRE